MNENEIPTGELFADLQVTLVEIELIKLLGESARANYNARLNANHNIRDAILGILRRRYSDKEIAGFLKNGYPREIKL